jgi:hypothetical protein
MDSTEEITSSKGVSMSIKRALAHIPFAVQAFNELKILAKSRSNNNILNQLENTPYRQGGQIGQALKSFQHTLSQADQTWKERIEIERKRLLARMNHSTTGV